MELSKILKYSPHYEIYSQESKTYISKKDSGLYSILITMIRQIILLEFNGYPVETLKIDYYGEELYELLFEKKDIQLDFSNISNEEKIFFEENLTSTAFGLGGNVKLLNFKITNQVINKFFNPSKKVLNYYDNLIKSNNIDLDNTIFVWARSTDKFGESRLPGVFAYLSVIRSIEPPDKEVLVQTDDIRVFTEFNNCKIKIKTIPEIPISGKLRGFHNEMNEMSDDKFKTLYNITKHEYFLQMYCLSLIGKNAYKTILYPGNPTTYIPMLKGSFDNCYLFKDDNHLF
jgi:hypothetical protein